MFEFPLRKDKNALKQIIHIYDLLLHGECFVCITLAKFYIILFKDVILVNYALNI